jgi:hypothetical protein
MAGKKGRSGGARKGAGRKSAFELNEEQLKIYLREIKKFCDEKNISPVTFLLSVMNNKLEGSKAEIDLRQRIMAATTLLKFNQMNLKQENINIKHEYLRPQSYLPEEKPDPAKLVPIDGGKKR